MRIKPLTLNMNISLEIIEGKPKNRWMAIAQKIALFGPILIIALCEMVMKNLIVYNFLNLGIFVINAVHSKWLEKKNPALA